MRGNRLKGWAHNGHKPFPGPDHAFGSPSYHRDIIGRDVIGNVIGKARRSGTRSLPKWGRTFGVLERIANLLLISNAGAAFVLGDTKSSLPVASQNNSIRSLSFGSASSA